MLSPYPKELTMANVGGAKSKFFLPKFIFNLMSLKSFVRTTEKNYLAMLHFHHHPFINIINYKFFI